MEDGKEDKVQGCVQNTIKGSNHLPVDLLGEHKRQIACGDRVPQPRPRGDFGGPMQREPAFLHPEAPMAFPDGGGAIPGVAAGAQVERGPVAEGGLRLADHQAGVGVGERDAVCRQDQVL